MNIGQHIRIIFWLFLISSIALAQENASLDTAETHLRFEAGDAPKLLVLQNGSTIWKNRSAEPPITSAEIRGRSIPLKWTFNSSASHADPHIVSFVYDSASPHLRLTWEWEARSGHGPIEHQVRIENRDTSEVWLPLENSFVFDWQISALDNLEQFYVEKGADTPSAFGTHLVPVPQGYDWEGTSSTYAHPETGEAREIIPWYLAERNDGRQRAGTWASNSADARDSPWSARAGDPSRNGGTESRSRPVSHASRAGGVFETPTVFLGAFDGGPDGAANQLRPWVRAVLGNPIAWKDEHYPLVVNNSWGSGMAVDEPLALRMIDESEELGVEMFHIDAGWFRGVGDWYPGPEEVSARAGRISPTRRTRRVFASVSGWTGHRPRLDTEPGALNVHDPKVRDWLVADVAPTGSRKSSRARPIDLGVPAARTISHAR